MGMNPTKAMQMAKKFIDGKGNFDTLKGTQDTLSKIEKEMKKKPSAQRWDKILGKRDPILDKAIAEFQRQTKDCNYLIKSKVDWPKDNTEKLLNDAARVAKADGVDGKKTRKITDGLIDDLNKRNLMLALCMRSAKIQSKKLDGRIKRIQQTKKYLKLLEKTFMTLTEYAVVGGFAAEAFTISRQCLEAYGEAVTLEKALKRLKAAYGGFYSHCEKLNRTVEDWIDIAGPQGIKHELEQRMK